LLIVTLVPSSQETVDVPLPLLVTVHDEPAAPPGTVTGGLFGQAMVMVPSPLSVVVQDPPATPGDPSAPSDAHDQAPTLIAPSASSEEILNRLREFFTTFSSLL
jgi:hypothetical protein